MKPLIILILLAFLAGCASPAANKVEPTAVSAGSSALENLAAAIPETSQTEPPGKPSALQAAPAAITQDGQTRLHLIDLASGADVAGSSPLELPAGAVVSASAASPDRIHLALTSGVGRSCRSFGGGSSCYEAAETLHLVDVAAWQKLDVALPGKGYATPLAFNPDSSRLALAYNTGKRAACWYTTWRAGSKLPTWRWISCLNGWLTSWAGRRWRFMAARWVMTRA